MSLTDAMHRINAAINREPIAADGTARAKTKVFISFASADRASAERCADDLVAGGFEPWWSGKLVGGQDFADVITAELESADAVVVLFSQSSVKSHWVKAEASRALALSKLVPVRLAGLDIKAVPLPMGRLHMQQFGDAAGLVRAIERIVAER